MKKIFGSLAVIGFIGAAAAGLTGAYFSDTETSTGNTFTAGALDLKVDNECHYYHLTGFGDNNQPIYTEIDCPTSPDDEGAEDFWTMNWEETDLKDGIHRFFYFGDIKPGDLGEDTISLHVYDNDAWGRFTVLSTGDFDNSCTEPEETAEGAGVCGTDPDGGELDNYMQMRAWLDQGGIPGFQCNDPSDSASRGPRCPEDPTEGDNKHQENDEPVLRPQTDPTAIDSFFDIFTEIDLRDLLKPAFIAGSSDDRCRTDAGGPSPDGHNNYGPCHGLAADGRMVGSTTYYIGWEWQFDPLAENDAQTDSLTADMKFEVVQHRNNPNPWTP